VQRAIAIALALLVLGPARPAAAANVSVELSWHTSFLTEPGQPAPACTQPPAGTWASFFLKTTQPGGTPTSVVMKVDPTLEMSNSQCEYRTERFSVPEGLVHIVFSDGMHVRQCDSFLEPSAVPGTFIVAFPPGNPGCSKSFVADN
jgi:hypothetical protein